MIVGPAGHEPEASVPEHVREGPGICLDGLLIVYELRCHRLSEGDRLRGDDVFERPALRVGEHGAVDLA